MTREIKFRAFYDGAIYNVTEIMWSDGTAYIVELDNDDNGETIDLDKIELLQFTGLRDKNRKEIYEGDVVRTHRGNCKVYFNHGVFCFNYPGMKNWKYLNGGGAQALEVIGNIYENPKLLT